MLDFFIKELTRINNLFMKYDFKYDCSILVAHDKDDLIVKIIDCSFKASGKNNKELKRIEFLIDLMLRIRAIKLKLLE